jgi:hypothetical protein
MGSISRAVKKIARPKVLLPLAAIALGGPALAGAMKGTAAGGALFGKGIASTLPASAAATGAGGTLLPIAKAAVAPTAGILGTGGAFAPLSGTLAKGIMFGLKNPLTAKGLATYGGLGSAALAMRGKPKTEAQKNLGVDPQAQYDLAREMNRMMGGAYTDEQLNTITAPMLSRYGGEYETITNPFQRRRRPMFPGLNYSGLTRFAKDGGSIKPKKRKDAIEEMANEIEQREIILDALFGGTTPGMNEDAIADQMFDMMRREELNPTGRAMGGRIGLANGGDLKFAVESFIRDFPEFEDLESKELYKEMEKRGYLSDRDEMKDGGIMQMASAPDPMAERSDMMENIALDKFGKSLDRLTDDEIIQIEEMIDDMMPMANGGAVTGMTDMINQNIDEMQEALTQQMQSGFTTQEAIVPVNAQEQLGAPPAPTLQAQASPSNFAMAQRRMGQLNPQARRQMFMNATPVTIGNRQGNFGQLRSLMGYANGGSIPQTKSIPAGMQLDGRGGGFIPMGARERKDDVPAMLAKNEFVMTADAVRGAGDGNVNVGAQRMYDLMNNLESKV